MQKESKKATNTNTEQGTRNGFDLLQHRFGVYVQISEKNCLFLVVNIKQQIIKISIKNHLKAISDSFISKKKKMF